MSHLTATSLSRLAGKRLFSRTRVVALGIAAAMMLALAASAGADTLC
jgi:hypothetical protein